MSDVEISLHLGQSKSLGIAQAPADGPQLTTPLPNFHMWNADNIVDPVQTVGNAWIPAVMGVDPGQTVPSHVDGKWQGSPDFYTVWRRAQANPTKQYYMFLIARGGERAEEWGYNGEQTIRIRTALQLGFDALCAAGVHCERLKYAVVNQSEGNHYDPDGTIWTTNHKACQDILERSKYGWQGMPFLYIPPVYQGQLSNRYPDVVAHANGTFNRYFVDTKWITPHTDNIHLTGLGSWVQATRIMNKLADLGL